MPSHKRSSPKMRKRSSPKSKRSKSSPKSKRYISKRKSSVRGRRVALCSNLKSPMACSRRVDCKYVKSKKSCVRRKSVLPGMKKYKTMYLAKEDVGRTFADIQTKSAEKLAMAKKALRDTLLAQQAEAKADHVPEAAPLMTPEEVDKIFSFMIRSPKKSVKKSPKKAKKSVKKAKKSVKKSVKKSHVKLSAMDCMNVEKLSPTALKLKLQMAGARVPKKASRAKMVEMAKRHCM